MECFRLVLVSRCRFTRYFTLPEDKLGDSRLSIVVESFSPVMKGLETPTRSLFEDDVVKSYEQKIVTFVETCKVITDALDEVAKIHPFITGEYTQISVEFACMFCSCRHRVQDGDQFGTNAA